MIEPELYERKTFRVIAVQVTADNMYEVAKWCGGAVKNFKGIELVDLLVPDTSDRFWAWEGSWITRLSNGMSFRVYSAEDFKQAFKKIEFESANRLVLQLVCKAIHESGGILDEDLAAKHSEEILKIFN